MQERFWAKVNKTDDCWIWTAGLRNSSGYGGFGINGRAKLAHRVAWEFENGPVPDGMMLDHLCHNRLCVRPSHLRCATPSENAENRSGPAATNRSGYMGVVRHGSKWKAQIEKSGKKTYLGLYKTPADASEVYESARRRLFGLDRRPADNV